MTTKAVNLSAPQHINSDPLASPNTAASIDDMQLQSNVERFTLTQKLNAFDAAVHGGELMAVPSKGTNFGASS